MHTRLRRRRHPLVLVLSLGLISTSLSGENLSPPFQTSGTAAKLPASLRSAADSYPSRVDRALKALKEGVEDYRAGRHAAAIKSLPAQDDGSLTAVYDYALVYRANSFLAMGNAEAALREFRLVWSFSPGSPHRQDAFLGEAKALIAAGRHAEAAAVLQRPGVEESAESLLLRARALEQGGDSQAAVRLYLRIYTEFVRSGLDTEALGRLRVLSPKTVAPQTGYRTLLKRAENLLEAARFSEVRSTMLGLGKISAPTPADYEMRNLLLGEAEHRLGRSTSALGRLGSVTTVNPEAHARALYVQASAYRRLGREESFLAARDTALRLYRKSPFTEKLLYSVATYHDVANRPAEAAAAYRAVVEGFPEGEHAERSRWKTAVLAYAGGDYREALEQYRIYLLRHPRPGTAAAAAYWLGKCFEKTGDHPKALRLYARSAALANKSYYGQRAAEALAALRQRSNSPARSFDAVDMQPVWRVLDEVSLPDPSIPEPSAEAARIIERARQLRFAGLGDLALDELRRGIAKMRDEKALSFVLSRMYESREDYFNTIVTMRRALPEYDQYPYHALPEEVWSLLFPVRHVSDVSRNAEKNGLETALILGVIRQESAFQEKARSTANARGLMQILPRTGRSLARQEGISYSLAKLYRASTNITLGSRHLSTLLRKYESRPEFALAAYNAGATRVDRWLREFGEIDADEFVEQIPLSETRGYVKQVLTNQAHYRLIASATQPSAH